jgi:5-methylcytosine-specific restriction endonuclease McrA
VIEPLSPARYRVQFTASAELRDKLERLQALMRSSVPDVDLAAVIEAAVTEKLEKLESRRVARVKAPRKGLAQTDTSPSSRHVPAAVRRAVHERDEGRCRYVDDQGQRCKARVGLELHHRRPFGLGGDHAPANVSTLCRGHNRYLAAIDYGRDAMARRGGPLQARSGRPLRRAAGGGSGRSRPPAARGDRASG